MPAPMPAPMSVPASERSPPSPPHRWPLMRARAALLWENAAVAFLPATCVILGLLALGMSGILPLLPGWLHVAVLGLGAIGLIAVIGLGVRRLRLPRRMDALRRVEVASGLQHRPLTACQDRLASQDGPARALWAAYQARVIGQLGRLRAGWPHSRLCERDPLALRALALLLCVSAAAATGGNISEPLGEALRPRLPVAAALPVQFDLWLTPPTYTGLPPVFATAVAPGQRLHVPTGSVLTAQVVGSRAAPTLALGPVEARPGAVKPAGQPDNAAFDAAGAQLWRIERTITEADQITVSLDRRPLGSWPVTIIPDQPPQIAFRQPPEATPRAALRLEWDAADDYGIDKITARITRTEVEIDAGLGDDAPPIDIVLSTPAGGRKTLGGQSQHDLTAHPWAGLNVAVTLGITDQAGQSAQTAQLAVTLPERRFTHPVARAIIAERKGLAAAAGYAGPIRQRLLEIAARTGTYGDDAVVFLGLITARSRLTHDRTGSAREPVISLLWDLAIRVEEGETGLRERDLKQIQEELRDAIARGADQAEIDRLMQELQRAMDRYLQAMVQQAMREGRKLPRQDGSGEMRALEQRDLQRMMDQARDAMRRGDRERAQQLLSELQQIMESLRAGLSEDEESEGSEAGEGSAQQTLDALQGLARRQRDLMDRAMRDPNAAQGQPGGLQQNTPQPGGRSGSGQGGQPGMGQPGGAGGLSSQQEQLRRDLGNVMQRLGEAGGEIPGALGRAERAMRAAQDALRGGRPGEALGPQGEALEQMRQAARNLAEQMRQARREQSQGGQSGRRGDGKIQPQERDPLGRAMPGSEGNDQGDLALPDASALERARAIFEELRRRASDPARPPVERDYLDRLLKQF